MRGGTPLAWAEGLACSSAAPGGCRWRACSTRKRPCPCSLGLASQWTVTHSLWWPPRPAHRGQPSSGPSSPEVSRPRPALRLWPQAFQSHFPRAWTRPERAAVAGLPSWGLRGENMEVCGRSGPSWSRGQAAGLTQGAAHWLPETTHHTHIHTYLCTYTPHIHTRTHLHTAPACPQHSTESGVFPQLPGGKIKASHFLLSSK